MSRRQPSRGRVANQGRPEVAEMLSIAKPLMVAPVSIPGSYRYVDATVPQPQHVKKRRFMAVSSQVPFGRLAEKITLLDKLSVQT